MNDSPMDAMAGAHAAPDPQADAAPSRSLGMWRVAITTDERIGKNAVVEIVLTPDALEIRLPDSPALRVPYGLQARFMPPLSQLRAVIYTDRHGNWIEVETQDSGRASDLMQELATREPSPGALAEPPPWGEGEPPPVLTRQYKGQKTAAAEAMVRESNVLQQYGYVPTSQTYAEGSWGCGAWVLAFLALLLLVGIIVLVYMAVNRPDGTLTVVYERRTSASTGAQVAPSPVATNRPAPAPPPSVRDRLGELDGLRADGLITDEEYAARRAAILESL